LLVALVVENQAPGMSDENEGPTTHLQMNPKSAKPTFGITSKVLTKKSQ